jgi:hypothetical protein
MGMEKPVIMEAEDRYIAYEMLKQLSFKSQTKIDMNKLEDVRVETPLIGISTKKRTSPKQSIKNTDDKKISKI